MIPACLPAPGREGALNFRQMEIFYEVMVRGSVSAAANRLGISQPAASKIVQQIEREVGYDLFDRIRGRLCPTDQARALFKEVKHAYAALDAVNQLERRLGSTYTGHIRIAAPPSLALEWLPDAVSLFNQEMKTATIEISTQHSGDMLSSDGQLRTRFDLGFTHGANVAPGLGIIEIGAAPIVCALPRSLKVIEGSEIALADLKGLPFIGVDETEPLGRLIHGQCEENGIALDVRIKAHAHHVALALAHRGEGFALVDWFTAAFYRRLPNSAALQFFTLKPQAVLPVTAVFPAFEGLNLISRRFIECARDALHLSVALPADAQRTV